MKKPPYHITSTLPTMALADKRVLLRADLNTPLHDNAISDDFRLRAIRPTLDLLLTNGASVVLVTHLGQPNGIVPQLSTTILLPWFKAHNYDIVYAQTLTEIPTLLEHNKLILLENIRFWPEEKRGDASLAQALSAYTDIFVQDAFGTLHRTDASITQLPLVYAPQQRTIGLHIEQELNALNRAMDNPEQPILALIGGGKITTKLPLIEQLINYADIIALLPAIANTFELSRGNRMGISPVDYKAVTACNAIINKAKQADKQLILPSDYIVAHDWPGPYRTTTSTTLNDQEMALTIGPNTVAQYQKLLLHARTIIINGPAGDLAYPATSAPMRSIFETLCRSNAYKLIAGGDSVAYINHYSLQHCVSYCSSGGGASIAYLSGHALPGLQAFI